MERIPVDILKKCITSDLVIYKVQFDDNSSEYIKLSHMKKALLKLVEIYEITLFHKALELRNQRKQKKIVQNRKPKNFNPQQSYKDPIRNNTNPIQINSDTESEQEIIMKRTKPDVEIQKHFAQRSTPQQFQVFMNEPHQNAQNNEVQNNNVNNMYMRPLNNDEYDTSSLIMCNQEENQMQQEMHQKPDVDQHDSDPQILKDLKSADKNYKELQKNIQIELNQKNKQVDVEDEKKNIEVDQEQIIQPLPAEKKVKRKKQKQISKNPKVPHLQCERSNLIVQSQVMHKGELLFVLSDARKLNVEQMRIAAPVELAEYLLSKFSQNKK